MDKFEHVKNIGTWMHPEAGCACMVYYDDLSRDWYEVRKSWTGGVVAVWPDAENNLIGSWCPVALDYVPIEGQTLYEVDNDTLPTTDMFELLGQYMYDGKQFTAVVKKPVTRTKAEILADLDALRAELEALKE